MIELLDNIAWHTLVGAHSRFATGAGEARRYARGFSPIAAFANGAHPDLDALEPYVDRNERFYCDGWSGPVPEGWRLEAESTMFKMIWDGETPSDEAPDARRLGPEHATQALELAALTRPGPFGPRTTDSASTSDISKARRWSQWLASACARRSSARSAACVCIRAIRDAVSRAA